jgi:hypothetical protein
MKFARALLAYREFECSLGTYGERFFDGGTQRRSVHGR